MSCAPVTCLGEFCSCDAVLTLPIEANETGTWIMYAKFNGVQMKRDITVVSGQKVEVPNIFNESYNHMVWFINGKGKKAYATNYSLKTVMCKNLD